MAAKRTRTRSTRTRKPTIREQLFAETPVFMSMEGPKKLGELGRGWNIVRDRAGRSLGESFAALRDGVAKTDAEWRAQDKVGKELVLYVGN